MISLITDVTVAEAAISDGVLALIFILLFTVVFVSVGIITYRISSAKLRKKREQKDNNNS
ncbi:MAG: hypothetical protein IIZ18_06515 [Ruminococcus sp.]|nr:hypothetical protein [Ruminococcus sp.]